MGTGRSMVQAGAVQTADGSVLASCGSLVLHTLRDRLKSGRETACPVQRGVRRRATGVPEATQLLQSPQDHLVSVNPQPGLSLQQ